MWRRAVRYLHARDDFGRIASLEQESQADAGRNKRRTFRQSMPLHRLRADLRGCKFGGAPRRRRHRDGARMRSDPKDYELVAPGSLPAAVALLARSPGEWLPIGGGTEL